MLRERQRDSVSSSERDSILISTLTRTSAAKHDFTPLATIAVQMISSHGVFLGKSPHTKDGDQTSVDGA